jgi:hypothetical protein
MNSLGWAYCESCYIRIYPAAAQRNGIVQQDHPVVEKHNAIQVNKKKAKKVKAYMDKQPTLFDEGDIDMNMKTEKKKKAVLVDIDGTLVTVTPNWSPERDLEWVEETLKADALDGGIALLKAFKMMGYELVFLTARGQTCKKNTWIKFRELGIDHLVDSIWHRPTALNGVSSSIYKDQMIKKLKKKFDLQFAMEDEEKNQEVMRNHGLVVIDAKKWW